MTSNLTIGSGGEGSSGEAPKLRAHYLDEWENSSRGGVSEIEEEFTGEVFDMNGGDVKHLGSIREEVEESVFSFDYYGSGDAVVYVAVGKQSEEVTSMDALIWTLNNVVIPPSSTVVFLIHVFPETKYIPTPLGKLPISQVNPEQKDNYMAQERSKRREFLQKFLNRCSTSKVQVDTILIESDMEAKSILDLIPVLNIRKLVLGTTKSNARRMRSKRGNGSVADQILQGAPEFCEVKIICEGKEMAELAIDSSSTSSSPKATDRSPKFPQQQQQPNDSSTCGCFNI
ncbi:hypothetical protein BUALT_Bualt03G0092600 [Buddleja alternifolia]|uniref:Uncharacterized protein n=1 Tax=Buddleja alternifolia TaxID=168488 RepID=A0AAV6XWL0_9LAMI|nr:hypothetical protein BUALT_Bualt03G0092600 [Buddleja alternifolia]